MVLKRIVQIIAIASVPLYFSATAKYSYTFDLTCLVLYSISSIAMLLNNCKTSLMKYEFFFTIAFLLTHFIYTTVYYNSDIASIITPDSFLPQFFNKGTALSLVGGSFFNLGVFDSKQATLPKTIVSSIKLYEPTILLTVLILAFLPFLYRLMGTGEYTTEFENSLLNVILICIIYYSLLANFNNASSYGTIKQKIKGIATIPNGLILVYVLLFLMIGSRTLPLRIAFILLFLFDVFISRFKKRDVIVASVVGLILMAFIRFDRTGGSMAGISLLNLGDDLIGCNRCLHYVMDYVSKNGFSYGLTLIITIISIIPHGASVFMELTGYSSAQLNSAAMITSVYGSANQGGLGTTIIADLYLAFGFIGVLVFMYLLGLVVRKLYAGVCKEKLSYIFLYALFIMDAVYINRSMYFVSATFIAWSYFLYLIFRNHKMKKRA